MRWAILAVVLTVILEIAFFMRGEEIVFQGNFASIYDTPYRISSVGYTVADRTYTSTTDDPQIIIEGLEQPVEYILVDLVDTMQTQTGLEIFYARAGEHFSQENSVYTSLSSDSEILVQIPEDTYEALRFDMSGTFTIGAIYTSEEPISVQMAFTNPFSPLRCLVVMLILFAVGVLFSHWVKKPNTYHKLHVPELLFCLAVFAFYTLWAVAQPYNYAPDEAMRYDVTQFLYEHNRLPVGDELTSIWGFSYAHLPTVLCNQLGYLFMKIASLFGQGDFFLLVAARMVSVCCATGAVYFVIKISKRLFQSPARWIAIVLFAFMPQYSFLASYVNNDIVALFGISMIVYSWILAIQDDWNIKNGAILSVGISTCALSYYNSYGWILSSVFMVTFTYLHKHRGDYKGFIRLAAGMSMIVLVLISYSFIRHVVLYGDLIGFQTTAHYGELYAIDELKPSLKLSLYEQGISFKAMFEPPYNWLLVTWMSFIGFFGYMQYRCPEFIYLIVSGVIFAGLIGTVLRTAKLLCKREKKNVELVAFYCVMFFASCVAIGLSMYTSYFTDFQPQGRYCYPIFVALVLFVAKGYEQIIQYIPRKEVQYGVVSAISAMWITVACFVYLLYYLPT